jgi:hypothetical protein
MTQVFEAIDKKWVFHDRVMRDLDHWDDAVARKTLASVVAVAEPFYWARDICELIEAAGTSLETWTPRWEDFVTSIGFNWFERPLHLPAPDDWPGPAIDMHGFLWAQVLESGSVLLATILPAPDPVGYRCGVILHCPSGEDALKREPRGAGPGSDLIRARAIVQMKYVAAAVVFMGQRIAVRHHEHVPRHALRRAERERRPIQNEVQVVRLRRAANDPSDRDSFPVDWQCRWVVQGHWRNQACGEGRTEQRPVWINPYLKGPETKPLKVPAQRLFAVVR